MTVVAFILIAVFVAYFFRSYIWPFAQAKWYGTEADAVVSRIEKDVRSTGGTDYATCYYYYYVTFQTESGLQNEARLLNPKKQLTIGDRVRVRYLTKSNDCAVLMVITDHSRSRFEAAKKGQTYSSDRSGA